MTKPFSRDLYNENDKLAKDAAKDFFRQLNGEVIPSEGEKFSDYDFQVKLSGKVHSVEVERKKVWRKSGSWEGWGSVDIPFRKSKSKADFFVMFNSQVDTLLVIRMSEVKNSPVKEKDTIYTKKEKFYSVPVEKFWMYTKDKDVWC